MSIYDGPTWWARPDHEYTAWMRDTVARRLATIAATMTINPRVMILCPLVEPPPTPRGKAGRRALRRWDRCCDRCTRYVPPRQDLICGTTTHQLPTGALATFTFGLCTGCADLEGAGRPVATSEAAWSRQASPCPGCSSCAARPATPSSCDDMTEEADR